MHRSPLIRCTSAEQNHDGVRRDLGIVGSARHRQMLPVTATDGSGGIVSRVEVSPALPP